MTQIDWSKIKTPADVDRIPKEFLFDEYEAYSEGSSPTIDPDLPEEDIEAAIQWLERIPDLIGVCLIIGEEGAGKTLLAHALAYDAKYLFNKLAILDRPPRSTFGRYIPFSTDFLKEQLARMYMMTQGQGRVTKDGRWLSDRGQVLLRHAVIMLDEFGGSHMSRLTSPMVEPKKTILELLSLNRHYQALWLGVGTQLNDFDRHCFPHVDYIISCERVDEPPYSADNIKIVGMIRRVRYNRDRDEFMPVGESKIIGIDASKPRDYLGGLAYKDIFHTDNVQVPTISKRMALKEDK